ncbi:MAG: hypothetical protein JWQ43_3803 [Glaciihabitans sp.]|nr:hypothetical protein [Glaciihabitans sp.]
MRHHWTPLANVYMALSAVGLVGTWIYNVLSIVQLRDYVGDWISSGPSVTSLTVDILIAVIAASVFIVVEARRLGMRHSWVYIVLTFVVAFAFSLPLFLAMRERQLQAQKVHSQKAGELRSGKA